MNTIAALYADGGVIKKNPSEIGGTFTWCFVDSNDRQILPGWMQSIYTYERNRLINWNKFKYQLLDGHPTKEQLKNGFGKRGHPVSKHNVWCALACNDVARVYLDFIGDMT